MFKSDSELLNSGAELMPSEKLNWLIKLMFISNKLDDALILLSILPIAPHVTGFADFLSFSTATKTFLSATYTGVNGVAYAISYKWKKCNISIVHITESDNL